MKRLALAIGIIAVSGVIFLSGCTKDEDTPQGDPSIAFVAEAGYISDNATLPVNADFKVKISAEQHPETKAKLTSLKISSTFTQTGKSDWDTTLSLGGEASVVYDLSFVSAPVEGIQNIDFLVIDENSRSKQIELSITTTGNVNKYEDIEIGSYDDLTGSFFVTSSGEVLNIDQATGRQEDVDFLFFFGATNGSTIASPADDQAINVFAIAGWTVKNDTRFIHPAPVGYVEFEAIGSAYDFPAFDEGSSATLANQLEANDVIFFQTVDGRKGYIKINSVTNRGYVANIDVIVEK